jgi:transposase
MGRFVEGVDRNQTTLFPTCLDDWIDEDNPVRVIDAFVDSIDLGELGFDGVVAQATGRPAYHPSVLLKLDIYGYRCIWNQSPKPSAGEPVDLAGHEV